MSDEKITAEAEGISSISMGENVGWITGPHDAVKAVQKLIIDGEGYRARLEISPDHNYDGIYCRNATIVILKNENADLKAELLIAENALANAIAKLQGSRQHRTEVKNDR